MLGHVFCEDLLLASRGAEASVLRTLVAQLDERVEEVSRAVFEAGMELIVVGGGHNNCLPILRAAHAAGGAHEAALSVHRGGDSQTSLVKSRSRPNPMERFLGSSLGKR